MRELLIVYENGAVEDCETLRSQITDAVMIKINPGFAFKVLEVPRPRRVLFEDGAIESEEVLAAELAKEVGIVVVNPGFRFEVLYL